MPKKTLPALSALLAVMMFFSAALTGERTYGAVSGDTVLSACNDISENLISSGGDPDYDDVWMVLGVERSGVDTPDGFETAYCDNTIAWLEENDWSVTSSTYTLYSRTIIGLTAAGYDATDVEGHNLFSYLADFSNVKKQGINGPIFALIALNCHDSYAIPNDESAAVQNSGQVMIDFILDNTVTGTDGTGWAIMGTSPDVDMTAMAITALAPYYGEDGYEDVTEAIDSALDFLSGVQCDDGAFMGLSGSTYQENCESSAQVVTALCALGIDPDTDSRLVKDGGSALEGLMSFYSEGAFLHLAGDSSPNGLATVQGFYALASVVRLGEGLSSLYDMNDLTLVAAEYSGSSGAGSAGNSGSNGDSDSTEDSDASAGDASGGDGDSSSDSGSSGSGSSDSDSADSGSETSSSSKSSSEGDSDDASASGDALKDASGDATGDAMALGDASGDASGDLVVDVDIEATAAEGPDGQDGARALVVTLLCTLLSLAGAFAYGLWGAKAHPGAAGRIALCALIISLMGGASAYNIVGAFDSNAAAGVTASLDATDSGDAGLYPGTESSDAGTVSADADEASENTAVESDAESSETKAGDSGSENSVSSGSSEDEESGKSGGSDGSSAGGTAGAASEGSGGTDSAEAEEGTCTLVISAATLVGNDDLPDNKKDLVPSNGILFS
ncbi:MAG: hypothetical protein K5840_02385 [Eubacterium sp.]|nr:hypothetical protein [Eubacterium sp.]